MRVAALYDVHGNPPALETVLADPGIELLRTPYDIGTALDMLAATGYPELEWLEEALRGDVSAEAATAEFEAERLS